MPDTAETELGTAAESESSGALESAVKSALEDGKATSESAADDTRTEDASERADEQKAEGQDNDVEMPDDSKLSPAELKVSKAWKAQYTRKTQEMNRRLKEATESSEQLKQLKAQYDQLLQHPDVYRAAQKALGMVKDDGKDGEIPLDPEAQRVLDRLFEKKFAEWERVKFAPVTNTLQKLTSEQKQERELAEFDKFCEKYPQARELLDDEDVSNAMEEAEKVSPNITFLQAFKVAASEKLAQKIVEGRLADLAGKTNKRTTKPTPTSGVTPTESTASTMDEIFREEARKLGLST